MNQMTQLEAVAGSPFKTRYDNFIGGSFVPPVGGRYFDNVTPITGAKICEIARSDAADISLRLTPPMPRKTLGARQRRVPLEHSAPDRRRSKRT